MFIITRNN